MNYRHNFLSLLKFDLALGLLLSFLGASYKTAALVRANQTLLTPFLPLIISWWDQALTLAFLIATSTAAAFTLLFARGQTKKQDFSTLPAPP